MLLPGMSVLVVRESFLKILLSGMEIMSTFTFKTLEKSFNSLMWSGRDDTFKRIAEKSVYQFLV